jgi:type IV secretion system protein VirD4
MKNDNNLKANLIFSAFGIVPVVWLALLSAPYVSGGFVEIIENLAVAINNPLQITVCEGSLKTVILFVCAYGMGIGIYFSTRRNYRKREEHGSAKWGEASVLNKKYKDRKALQNKLLTQNVRIGLDGKKHRRTSRISRW